MKKLLDTERKDGCDEKQGDGKTASPGSTASEAANHGIG